MAKHITINVKTEKDIINEYGLGYADLMDLFGVSKQRAFEYLRGEGRPSTDALREVAKAKVGEMEGRMANEMLTLRGADVPCVCETELWDRGECPKHGKPSRNR